MLFLASLRRHWVTVAVIVGLLGIFAVDYARRMPKARQKADALDLEIRRIRPEPTAELIDSVRSVKTANALVGARYRTSVPDAVVRKHFEDRLRDAGWRPCVSGQQRFCKDEFEADLFIRGTQRPGDWNVGLDLTWGLNR